MWQREAKPITDDNSNLTTELMVLFSITSHPNPFKAIHTLTKTHKVTQRRQKKNKTSVQRQTIQEREKEMEKKEGCVGNI